MKSIKAINQHRKCCRFSFFCCWRCFAIFKDYDSLRLHQLKSGHDNNQLPPPPLPRPPLRLECDEPGCKAWFYERAQLNRHKRTHSKPFRCSAAGCQRRFGNDWHRKIHERTHNAERSEKCRFCERAFRDPAALRKHVKRAHTDGASLRLKPFVCRKCCKRFESKFCLQSHARMHMKGGDRDRFACGRCRKEFTTKSNLTRHMKGRCRC